MSFSRWLLPAASTDTVSSLRWPDWSAAETGAAEGTPNSVGEVDGACPVGNRVGLCVGWGVVGELDGLDVLGDSVGDQ